MAADEPAAQPGLPVTRGPSVTLGPGGESHPPSISRRLVPKRDVGPEEEGGSLDWKRYLAAVYRYRWAVLAVTIAGTAAGFGVSRLVLPRYRAEATVWIEADARRSADRGPIRQDPMLTTSSWTELLKSYVVLDEVIRETRRYLSVKSKTDKPAFAQFELNERFRPGFYRLKVGPDGRSFVLETREGSEVQRGTIGDSIGNVAGFRWVPGAAVLRPGRTVGFTILTPREAAMQLTRDLRVIPDGQGNFLRIELEGTDPTETAETVNAMVQRFVIVAADLKRTKLTELTAILSDQLNVSERHLRDAEKALGDFRIKTITLPSERASPLAPGLEMTRDPVLANFFDMKIRRDQLRRDRETIEEALAHSGDSIGSLTSLALVESVRNSAELARALEEVNTRQADLRALLYRYTEQTPAAQRLRSELSALQNQTIPRLARALVGNVKQQEKDLDDRIGSASGDLRQIPPRAIEEARLRRDVTIAENLYTTLQQRYEEARLAEASSIPDLRILDNAVAPEQPSKNTAPRVMLLALLGSLGLAVLGAVSLDRVDSRVRYPEQVSTGLGLPILGSIPRATASVKPGSEEAQAVVEGLRGVRLSVSHAYGAAGPYLFAISSPGPGEGKSFVASNLALAFADAGYNTLLVDGDLRRGALHRVLEARRKPGLTDYLNGQASTESIVQKTYHPSLRFIGCGTWMQKAPELLGSDSMGRLLGFLRGNFSVIVVDTPPLGVGIDPLVWGTATGNMVLVLRTGITNRDMAASKLELLDRLPIRLLGAVLNDVRADAAYRYYSYLPGYYVTDEQPAAVEAREVKGGGA